jgi:hypothetical protein
MTFACVAWRNYRIYWADFEPPSAQVEQRVGALSVRSRHAMPTAQRTKKKPVRLTRTGFYLDILGFVLDSLYIGGLLAFRPLGHFERNFLPFFEGFESAHLNRREMRKQIFTAVVRRNEAIPLRVIEPFHSTCCHIAVPYSLKKLPENRFRRLFEFQGRTRQNDRTGTAIKLEAKHLSAF